MTMKKTFLLLCLLFGLLTACSYDDGIEVYDVKIRLVSSGHEMYPHPGMRVELRDASTSVFVDSTDASGGAHFRVPPGVYEAMASRVLVADDYRYIYNGVKSQIVIAPDSINVVEMKLTLSKKRR